MSSGIGRVKLESGRRLSSERQHPRGCGLPASRIPFLSRSKPQLQDWLLGQSGCSACRRFDAEDFSSWVGQFEILFDALWRQLGLIPRNALDYVRFGHEFLLLS